MSQDEPIVHTVILDGYPFNEKFMYIVHTTHDSKWPLHQASMDMDDLPYKYYECALIVKGYNNSMYSI